MKKALALALLLSFASPALAAAAYIGNINSMIFHEENCRFGGKRIKEENRVCFSTRGEAVSAGYRPCKVCRP